MTNIIRVTDEYSNVDFTSDSGRFLFRRAIARLHDLASYLKREPWQKAAYRRIRALITAGVVMVSSSAMLTGCQSIQSPLPPGVSFLMSVDSSFGKRDSSNKSVLLIDGSLTEANDGSLYWTSPIAGADGSGAIFRMTKKGEISLIYSFSKLDIDAAHPHSGVIQAADGNFYGVTGPNKDRTNSGILFRLTPKGKMTALYTFGVKPSDPQIPASQLIEDQDGIFYGVTARGGPSDRGAIYRVTSSGEFSVLHFFEKAKRNGYSPSGDLTLGFDGNLYGTTEFGGEKNQGILYRLSRSGKFTLLHSFGTLNYDGINPRTGVAQGKDNSMYGTVSRGGEYGSGVIFRFSPEGKYSIVSSFPPDKMGHYPSALVAGSDDYLYGTTCSGRISVPDYEPGGQFYRVNPQGKIKSLYSFGAKPTDGICPYLRFIAGKDGYFYGSTFAGGKYGLGTIYQMVAPK